MTARWTILAALSVGLAVAGVGTAAFVLASGPVRADILVQLAVHVPAGREAAIPAGIGVGLTPPQAFVTALAYEWSLLLIGFPVLAFVGTRLHDWRPVRDALARAEAFAAERPGVGILFLGALSVAPFLPIGALTAALIGEALRLPATRLLPLLIAADVVANASVTLAAGAIIARFPDPTIAAFALAAAMLALGLLLALAPWRRAA